VSDDFDSREDLGYGFRAEHVERNAGALHDQARFFATLRALAARGDHRVVPPLIDDPRWAEIAMRDPRLIERLLAQLSRTSLLPEGPVDLRSRPRDQPGPRPSRPRRAPPMEPAPPPEPSEEEEEEEERIRSWRIECGHHASDATRDLVERGTVLQIVPDVADDGRHVDLVKVHWRDDFLGALPGALTVRSPHPEVDDFEILQAGSADGHTVYDLEAVYRHDVDGAVPPFWRPAFWRSYTAKTTYRVSPGPAPIRVEVFHPHRWKFELKLPPWASFQDGHKWTPPEGQGVKGLANRENLKHDLATEDAFWKPSKLAVDTVETDTSPDPDFKPRGSEMKLDSVSLSRDDTAVDMDALLLIGKLLKLQESFRDLVSALKAFRDYAPQMGWYADVNLQLMQGGIAAEWYWKEHTDHRVFQFIDVNLSLVLFNLTFEVGLGVGAFSFELQIYASIGGELAVEGGFQRDTPDGRGGLAFPTIQGKVVGALGARVEGGAFFKFGAKGETALEAEVNMAINENRRPFSADLRVRWTGIECTATGSIGLWGIGGTRTWTSTLVQPSAWIGSELPSPQPYEPPHLSRARIFTMVKGAIDTFWQIRVIRTVEGWNNDVHWTTDEIAEAITDRIDDDPVFNRTVDSVEGLCLAMRGDLDALGSRWGRNYVEEAQFLEYLDGSLEGRSFETHLDRGRSPERMLIQANR
jgi:hypothetical protein